MAATYLTLAEAAQLTGKSVKTMRRLAHSLREHALADGTPAVQQVAKPGGFGYTIAHEALGLGSVAEQAQKPAARPPRKAKTVPAEAKAQVGVASQSSNHAEKQADSPAVEKNKSGNGKKKKAGKQRAEVREETPVMHPPTEDTLPKGQRAPDRAAPPVGASAQVAPPMDVWRELIAAKDAMIAALQAELHTKNEQIRLLMDSKEHSDILLKVLTDRLTPPAKPLLTTWSNAPVDFTEAPKIHATETNAAQSWQAGPQYNEAPATEGFGGGVDAAIDKVRKMKDKKKKRR